MHPLDAGDPRTIGAYRLLGRLGAGGMGRVYLGRSAGGRTVAIKSVHPHFAMDDEFRARFRREVEAARRVGGEWTAPVLDADPDASVPWVATGYVAGPSLDRAVAAHGPLPEAPVRALGAALAEALAAVHALGLVHRDVKPSNVMLTLDGPRLIDFGIARATDGTASLTSTGVSIGSPGYMSPEQIVGKGTTAAADVFSLGAVLAFAASGHPPYSGDNSATLLYKVVHEEPDLERVPAGELRELAAACLAKNPSDRPAPARIAAVLAPQGAAAAVGPGWLPPVLVEEISRSAVRLLDLEADTGAGAGAGSGSGSGSAGAGLPADVVPVADAVPDTAGSGSVPTGYGSGAVPAGYGSGAVPAGYGAGGFGPPDPSYGKGEPYAAHASYGTGTGNPYTSGTHGHGGPVTGGPVPGIPAPREAERGTRFTVTARAGRRASCTVALAVAGALAAVTVGGYFLTDLFPGSAKGKDSANETGGGKTGPSVSAAATPPTGGPGQDAGRRDSVPEALTGTWKGRVTTKNFGVPVDFQITISAGKVGQVVGRDKSVLDLLGTEYDCSGEWKLASATDRSLVLDTAGGTNPHPGICADGSSNERFTLNANGTLHYASGDAAAGKPEGDLTREP
ncbi:serine/threonine-protein kinase [Streptomyces sp. NPDC101118]|uniref:serine/threonine-protein kinase n=1 Tax=Streptomyces sp. NPDC101118 TaxID=3366109 RepID=UPI0037F2C42E